MLFNRNLIFLLLLLTTLNNSFASPNISYNDKLPRPKLVVGIVVDQMRWDYLYRYYERYGSKGFKRLLNEGFSNENTYINHIPTVTGAGHATIFTGTVPAIHGITGNTITFNSTGETVNCVEDLNVQSVGVPPSKYGQRSPFNLMVSTIGDELKLATNFRSKVIGVSLKDRAAILPAGHSADAAYWFDKVSGNWMTSTYYMESLPKWAVEFNNENLAEKYLKKDWHTLYKIDAYKQSSADKTPWEGLLRGQKEAVLPAKTSEWYKKDDYTNIYSTPFGNSITLDFVKEVIKKEKLGKGDDTDFLAVSFSSTDAIGHIFGVNSVEVEDTYLRLDKDIAELLSYLDRTQGKDNYTVFLTADHGGNHNVRFLNQNKIKTHPLKSYKEEMNTMLMEKLKVDNIITFVGYSQVKFNYKVIRENNLVEQDIRDLCVDYLRRQEDVVFVMDLNKAGDAAIPEEVKIRMINGHHPERAGGIQYILNPNAKSLKSRGSAHSDWNAYDSKIPLLWMGWGIKKGGRSMKQAHMIDIAPTVSSLLRIQPPNGNIGKALEEVFE